MKVETGLKEKMIGHLLMLADRLDNLKAIKEDPLESPLVDVCVEPFRKLTGKTPRDTQLITVKFLFNLLVDTDVKTALIQMQVGSGKNFVQSFLAQVITAVFKEAIVFIVHASEESCHHNYLTYGKGDPACGLLGKEGKYLGQKVVYCDVKDAVSLVRLAKKYTKRAYMIVDEVEKVMEKPLV
jgi:superfamily II DNA or RNA helicase